MKIVAGRGYETYSSNEFEKERETKAKANEEKEEKHETAVPIVTHVNNISKSFSSYVAVYFNNQQNFNFNGLYSHEIYLSNNFKRTISEYIRALHCKDCDYEDHIDENMAAPLSEPFFTRKRKMCSRPDGFMMHGKLGVDFSSFSELLYPNMKIRLRLIRAVPKSYVISDVPNVGLGIVDCSHFTRGFGLKDDYHKKWMDLPSHKSVEYNYLETPATTFNIPARQNEFIHENIFGKESNRRIATALNTNSAFTGSYTENRSGISNSISDVPEFSEDFN